MLQDAIRIGYAFMLTQVFESGFDVEEFNKVIGVLSMFKYASSESEWVYWFNNRRLLEPIGNIPPAEFEMAYYRQLGESTDTV